MRIIDARRETPRKIVWQNWMEKLGKCCWGEVV